MVRRDRREINRRDFLNAAAVGAGGAALMAFSPDAASAQAQVPASPRAGYPARTAGRIDILFKAPGSSGNGMQCTEEGIWTIDVAGSRTDTPGRCKVYLSSYEGRPLRELSPEGTGPSGIGVDQEHGILWIGSTYSREIIRADAKTGETLEKHFTPGAGVIYHHSQDIPPRPDTYGRLARTAAGRPEPSRGRADGAPRGGRVTGARGVSGQNTGQATSDGLGVGRGGAIPGNPGPPAPGTGAHGQQVQNGKLWMAVPPARMIYRVDPATWTVEHMYPTVGYRPHGIGIETPDAAHLWEADSNMLAFFKRDMLTGEIVDSIILPDGAPCPHGASVWNGYIYWVDDIGGGIAPVCRTKI